MKSIIDVAFKTFAEGSVAELDTLLIIALKLEYCTEVEIDKAFKLILEQRKMLSDLRIKLTTTHEKQ